MQEVSSMLHTGTLSYIGMLYIGIDVHKKFCYVCIMDKEGNIKKEFRIQKNKSGIKTLLSAIGNRRAKAVL